MTEKWKIKVGNNNKYRVKKTPDHIKKGENMVRNTDSSLVKELPLPHTTHPRK